MLKSCIGKENDCKFAFFLCVRDSSTCEAVPKRSEGMSREDGEVPHFAHALSPRRANRTAAVFGFGC